MLSVAKICSIGGSWILNTDRMIMMRKLKYLENNLSFPPPFFISQIIWMLSTLSHPIYLSSTSISSFHLCIGPPSGLFPSCFPTISLYVFLFFCVHPTCHMPCPSHPPSIHYPNNSELYKFWSFSLCNCIQSPVNFYGSCYNIFILQVVMVFSC